MGTETALIFGSIPCPSWDFLEPLRGQVTVICADGGTLCAQAAGFRAEVYVGDSDSGGVPPAGARQVLLPAEKDLTDLQAAYQCARDGGFRRMVFTACTGGRQDHHLANLQLLETALEEGIDAAVCLYDGSRDRILCIYAGALDSDSLVKSMRRAVPKYMLPNVYHRLERLPYNANGKVDRVKLKEQYLDGAN